MSDDGESPDWIQLRRPAFPIRGTDSSRPSPVREIVADGVVWLAWERACPDAQSGGSTRCLFFHAVDAVRQVCAYPASWHQLSDGALFDLSRAT